MMSKDTLLAVANELPDEIEIEAVLERLIFMAKVEEGIRQSEAGETIAHEDVKKIA